MPTTVRNFRNWNRAGRRDCEWSVVRIAERSEGTCLAGGKVSAYVHFLARKEYLMATGQVTSEGILQLGLAFWGSKALLSAVELGLFTELAKGPLEANVLAKRLALHP